MGAKQAAPASSNDVRLSANEPVKDPAESVTDDSEIEVDRMDVAASNVEPESFDMNAFENEVLSYDEPAGSLGAETQLLLAEHNAVKHKAAGRSPFPPTGRRPRTGYPRQAQRHSAPASFLPRGCPYLLPTYAESLCDEESLPTHAQGGGQRHAGSNGGGRRGLGFHELQVVFLVSQVLFLLSCYDMCSLAVTAIQVLSCDACLDLVEYCEGEKEVYIWCGD